MGWALTALVLGSVSLLVVVLTIEQSGQAMGQRSGMAVSGGRYLVLRRLLLSARTVAVATGNGLRSAGRVARRQAGAAALAAVAVSRSAQDSLRTFVSSRRRRQAVPGELRRRVRRLRFEDCLQSTAPEFVEAPSPPGQALSLSPAPRSAGWHSRLASAFELVMVIALAGGAVALALVAVGWRASKLF